MKVIILIFSMLFLALSVYAENINIYYPSTEQNLCSDSEINIRWKGIETDYLVEVKTTDNNIYKKIQFYSINNNEFVWKVNDKEFYNKNLTFKISEKNNPLNFAEISNIYVNQKTEIINQTQSFTVCKDEMVYLQIDALGIDLSYQWFKDNELIAGATSNVLKIDNTDYSHSGIYICKISTSGACDDIFSKPISVYVATPTNFLSKPEDVLWEYNKSVNITALLHINNDSDLVNVKFKWYKDTIVYIHIPPQTFIPDTIFKELNDNDKYYGTKSQELIINNLVWSDRTIYYCVAEGLCGIDTISARIGDESRFEIIKLTPDFSDCEGNSITFKAKVETKVKADFTYQWYKTGMKMLYDGDKYSGTNTLELTIKNADKSDEAAYYLMVIWREKSVYKRSELFLYTPESKPQIGVQSKDWVINSKRNYYPNGIQIYVYAKNIKTCYYEWFKGGKIILEGFGETTIRRLPARKTDTGWYQCRITNDCGETWADSIYIAWGVFPEAGNCLNEDVDLIVDEYSDEYHYIWEKDGTLLSDNEKISGSSSPSLKIIQLELKDEGYYKVWKVHTATDYKLLIGNIYVEVETAPNVVRDFPAQLVNEGDYVKLISLSVLSKGEGIYYTLYYNGMPEHEEIFRPRDASKNIDYGFVMGGMKSNVKPGTYQYKFRNDCGETWSTKMNVINSAYKPGGIITDDDFTSSYDEMKDVQNFKIYPNPASDYITIPELNNGLQPIVHKVQIFDVLGIDVSSAGASVIEVDGGGYRIDISKLPAGVYFMIVGGMVEKFVKM